MDTEIVVEKRDGTFDGFDPEKIVKSLVFLDAAELDDAVRIAGEVAEEIRQLPIVREAQKVASSTLRELVEKRLSKHGKDLVKADREWRDGNREKEGYVFSRLREITDLNSELDVDLRENANINAITSMGMMLKAGSDVMKHYYLSEAIAPEFAWAHRNGDIHIHDLDFYGMTTTCLQIDLDRLFREGFTTGHGTIRPPQSIRNYWSLLCIVIQANQNEQHGGQSIPKLEYDLAPGVAKSFARILANVVIDGHDLRERFGMKAAKEFRDYAMEKIYPEHGTLMDDYAIREMSLMLRDRFGFEPSREEVDSARMQVVDECLQGAEACVHNLCTMNSRAGSQVPFSSINYGTGTSPEQRIVIECILKALDNGLGNGETQIFPIHIFKVKDGVNYKPGDPNYDMFRIAIAVTAKRLFPNFEFLDAPYNLKYYREGDPDTEVATMGCRTRVMGNVNGPETTSGRGNLSFTSINLPRLAIKAKGDVGKFFDTLDYTLDLCVRQLLERFKIQCSRKVINFPFMFGNHLYMNSDHLKDTSTIFDALKNGTLSVGFVGLAEALVALIGEHHGESERARDLGYRIVKRMREAMDAATKAHHLNFTLLATPAESTAGTLLCKDRKEFGVIKGVTDRDYYTNSNHVPVWCDISAKEKIDIEAPYHELCNAGHICYVEYDGDPKQNLEAVEKIVRWMHDADVGYGAINHPVDTCRVCGHTGIINDECPICGNDDQTQIKRLRRITGYLVGDRDSRFNAGKIAEERDRVKHRMR